MDEVNEKLTKTVEKDKLNKDFLLELHRFKSTIQHVMTVAETQCKSDLVYRDEPDKRKIYEHYLKKLSDQVENNEIHIELACFPIQNFSDDISHSPLAVSQRIEELRECIIILNDIEGRICKDKGLLDLIDNLIDKHSFKEFLHTEKNALETYSYTLTEYS
ncbi:hypothetical protein MDMS009_847 [Methylophaga thiooxydans DMS010]|uniref:Uncharacterized protein n=2 Tax=Methylophaga thiooxydans TaxID=392484 RepID=C0N457_9GAMM|nr:hypothetical protein MDMS009_847 [Methylophaga thiooxydans DMS010]